MARLSPNLNVLRALFARSGNQCAFPGCTQAIVNNKNNFIGQVCHIEAALKNGERYNPNQTDEERRDYKNLLILCYPHHIETNDVNEFPVARMHKIKNSHEALFEKSDFKIDESELRKLSHEMEKYWNEIDWVNKLHSSRNELAYEIDPHASFDLIMQTINESLEALEDIFTVLYISDNDLPSDFVKLLKRKNIDPTIFNDIPVFENPLESRNWDSHNIAVPNWIGRLKIDITHITVKYLEEYLKTNRNDLIAKYNLEQAKESLKELAANSAHVD
jgi:hypothetical protein